MTISILKECFVFCIIMVKNIIIMTELLSEYYYVAEIYFILVPYYLCELLIVCSVLFDRVKYDINLFIINGFILNLILFICGFLYIRRVDQLKVLFISLFSYMMLLLVKDKTQVCTYSLNVTKKDVERYGNVCCICIEDMNELKQLVRMNCNHVYHKKCLQDYVKVSKKYNCPTCRQ
jgi:hypothetical protein